MVMRIWWRFGFLVFLFVLPIHTVYFLREPILDGEKWQYGTIGIYATDIVLFLVLVVFVVDRLFFLHPKLEMRNLICLLGSFGWRVSGMWKCCTSLLVDRRRESSQACVHSPHSFLGVTWRHAYSRVIFFCMFVAWTALSISWAPDRMLAGYFLMKLLLAGGVWWISSSLHEHEVNEAVVILCIGAVLESALGIGQFFLQQDFSSTWLGVSAHEAWRAGTSVLVNDSGRWLRAYGTFPHPNMLGGYLGAILVLGIGYFSRRIRSIQARVFFWGWAGLILLGLMLTFSRVAWSGTAFTLVMFAVIYLRRARAQSDTWRISSFNTRRLSGLDMFFFVMFLLTFVGVLSETILPRFETGVIAREGSVSERIGSFQDAQRVMQTNSTWLGVGAGNMTVVMKAIDPGRPAWDIQPAHNVPLLLFTELGAVGMVLFACILLLFFQSILSVCVSRGRVLPEVFSRVRVSSICAFLVLFPSLFLDHWLLSSHFGLLFLFLFAGLAYRPVCRLNSGHNL